jgi:hypothetical protein
MAGAGMLGYLKRAFLTRWNLLLFIGAAAGAALSPWPDALLPLVAATELVYLGGLISVPRFRTAVDAAEAERARAAARAGKPGVADVMTMVQGLSPESQQRFIGLRKRCQEMRSIARGAPGAGTAGTDLWTPALDRLLFGFLRLLGQHHSLGRFLRSTSEAELGARKAELEKKLAAARGTADERMVNTLEESVAIADQRLDNYRKAAANAEFLSLELDRVEAKIHALVELAANRQDAEVLGRELDAAAESMHRTEAAMDQLEEIGRGTMDIEEVPAILDHAPRARQAE